jgi:hypothetical protein
VGGLICPSGVTLAQLDGNGASTAQALKVLDYFLATDLLL